MSSFEPISTAVEADIAVSFMLAPTVLESLQIPGEDSGLPRLPSFSINLYLPRSGPTDIAVELERHVREQHAA